MELYENKNGMYWNIEPEEIVRRYIEENKKQKEVLDKIKEYCNNRLQYYNEMRRDYMKEFDGYAENDNENILELLEAIDENI